MYLHLLILFFLFAVSYPASASAEFYKYTDESGVVRFTDNLADIPEDQRQKIPGYKSLEEVQPAAEPEAENGEAADTTPDTAGLSVEKIRNSKAELDKERAQLTEERNAITEERKKEGITPEEQIALNERTDALNLRITEFEKKQEDYRNQVSEFNRQIDELNFRKKPKK